MSTHAITAKLREEKGSKNDAIRAEGKVPAVVYGTGTEPLSITLDRNEFIKIYHDAGESSLINLQVEGKEPLHVLIHDFQQDAISDQVIHVDFHSVDINKEIEADVDLEFVGEPLAVKALGGTFIPSRDSITVRCLPTKLVRNIKVDISTLKTFDDTISVRDLQLPEGIIAVDAPELNIASISAPQKDEDENVGTTEAEAVAAVASATPKKEEKDHE